MSKDIEEFPTFLGYYHKHNCLKFRIAYVLFLNEGRPQDTKMIAEFLNEPLSKISNALSRYKKSGSPYFRRIKKWRGATNHDVRWRLTNSGVRFLANCMYNIHNGKDLNFKRNPMQVHDLKDRRVLRQIGDDFIFFSRDEYAKLFGINGLGVERLGIEVDDVLSKVSQTKIEDKEVYI